MIQISTSRIYPIILTPCLIDTSDQQELKIQSIKIALLHENVSLNFEQINDYAEKARSQPCQENKLRFFTPLNLCYEDLICLQLNITYFKTLKNIKELERNLILKPSFSQISKMRPKNNFYFLEIQISSEINSIHANVVHAKDISRLTQTHLRPPKTTTDQQKAIT